MSMTLLYIIMGALPFIGLCVAMLSVVQPQPKHNRRDNQYGYYYGDRSYNPIL